MKKHLHRALYTLVILVFLGSAGMALYQTGQYWQADRLSQQAQSAAGSSAQLPDEPTPLAPIPEPEPEQAPLAEQAQFLLQQDLEGLREVNGAVLGWICIPDTPISYPLLAVKDNEEYLRRAWDGTKNNAGCIFLECKNQRDFSDFNTIIYGHYMRNGTMFGSLHEYRDPEYLLQHPAVYIVTDEQVRRYEIFASYEADVVSDTYRLYFEDDQRREDCLAQYREQSVVGSPLAPTAQDSILTLSTCTGSGYQTRWVVQAVLTGQFPR